MHLLVLAQTPPPLHGQSFMVRTLVEGLPQAWPACTLQHINLPLSRTIGDMGRPDLGKLFRLVAAARAARAAARRHGLDTLYYVPAPGRRVAVWRDALLLRFVRPHFRRLVLHWHAAGLAGWVDGTASSRNRALAHRALDGADLSLVLDPGLRADAEVFRARRIAVVPNGLADPGPVPPALLRPEPGSPSPELPTVLFLGMLTRDKGIHDAIAAVRQLRAAGRPVRLVIAGRAPTPAIQTDIEADCLGDSRYLTFAGFADETRKRALFGQAAALLFPSVHPYEAQPLTVIEAMAYDMPVAGYAWRGVPGILPEAWPGLVAPGNVSELARALGHLLDRPRDGALRERFLARFTREQHLASLAAALRSLDEPAPPAAASHP